MSAVGLLVVGGSGDDLREHGSHDARGIERRGTVRNFFWQNDGIRASRSSVSQTRPEQAAGATEAWMTQYLISFGAHAMDHIPGEDAPAVARAAHATVQEAINAGVYVSAGGLENQPASIVATDGAVTDGPYPEAIGGFTLVEVPSREEALQWAAKIAIACRCAQEVREIGADPELDAMLRQADGRR
jgi:hypothetical protein